MHLTKLLDKVVNDLQVRGLFHLAQQLEFPSSRISDGEPSGAVIAFKNGKKVVA